MTGQTLVSGAFASCLLCYTWRPEEVRAAASDLEADLVRFPLRGTAP